MDTVEPASEPGTSEAESEGSEVQGQPQLHDELKANRDYVSLCLKKTQQNKKSEGQRETSCMAPWRF